MATEILQANVGAGKTEAVLQALSGVVNDPSRPFARVWVLLASGRQEVAFRQRLATLPDARQVYFNTEVLSFPKLYDRLLKVTDQPRQKIHDSARSGLVRALLVDLQRQKSLTTFDSIADSTGLTQLITELLAELKQNLIAPEVFKQGVQSPKDHDIALIYEGYQATLIKHDLVDTEGEAWLTLEALQRDDTLANHIDLLIVDGFDQFSEVQARILAMLARHIGRVIITLTALSGREQSIGRRFQRALERLQGAHLQYSVPISIRQLEEQSDRHPDLRTLSRDVFDLNATAQMPRSGDAIRFLSAPEPHQEVAMVLRDVKQKLLAGISPGEILVALRDWETYHTHFEVYRQAYDLPLLLHYDEPLKNNPALNILMKALHLAPTGNDVREGFLPRDVLEILRSPYVRVEEFDEGTLQVLERMSREGQVISGREAWFDRLEAHSGGDGLGDIDDDERILPFPIDAEVVSIVSIGLEAFFDAVTMPIEAPLNEYIRRIEQLIGNDPLHDPEDDPDEAYAFDWSPYTVFSFDMVRSIRAMQDDPDLRVLTLRDIHALQTFKDILRGYLATSELFQAVWGYEENITWQALLRDLSESVANQRTTPDNSSRSGRVLITTATNARGLPHDHIYILGLSEGIFPAPRKEDPLYLDNERRALRERGIYLPTQDEKTDDTGLFYELISLARHTLTLSRPTIQQGKPHNESYLWRMTRETFAPDSLATYAMKIGEVPAPEQVVTLDEALLTLSNEMRKAQLTDNAQILYAWVMADEARQTAWQTIISAMQTEQHRLSSAPYDRYTGVIEAPELRTEIHDYLVDFHRWSASQFNQVGACGYQFFASRLLNLKPVSEPEEGFDNLQYGSLMHTILERIYAEIMTNDVVIHPENIGVALEIMAHQLETVLTTAPDTLGVTLKAQWVYEQQAIRRQIEALVRFDFSDKSPLYREQHARTVYAIEQFIDVVLTLEGWDAPVRVRGYIDRIDRIDDHLFVMDYKTGTPPGISDLKDGRNFQMFVYLRGLAMMLEQRQSKYVIGGGFFWKLRGEPNLVVWSPDNQAFAMGERHLVKNLIALHQADFAVAPSKRENDRCSKFCDFYQLCRLANINPYKEHDI